MSVVLLHRNYAMAIHVPAPYKRALGHTGSAPDFCAHPSQHVSLLELWNKACRRTLCKVIYRQLSMRILRQVLESHLGLTLSNHEMYNDQTFEYDGPC